MSSVVDISDLKVNINCIVSVAVFQLKEMCRRELERAESESVRNTAIIADYKQVRVTRDLTLVMLTPYIYVYVFNQILWLYN